MKNPVSGASLLALLYLLAAPPLLPCASATVWTPENWSRNQSLPKPPPEVDVIIVGGGYSGLTAAYHLHRAGLSTLILEAKNLVGGKSRSIKRKNAPGFLELGATWINNVTQPEVYKLSQEFGLDLMVQYVEGAPVFQGLDGTVSRGGLSDNRSSTGKKEKTENEELELKFFTLLELTASKLNLTRFDNFPEDEDLTVSKWISKKGFGKSEHIKGLARALIGALVGRDPDDIGIHYILDYIKSGRGLRSLMAEDQQGAQFQWIKQGTTAIATSMAASIPLGSVLINSPVSEITQSNSSVTVTTIDQQTFQAKKVLVAITQNMYPSIKFSPPLPHVQQQVSTKTTPGIYAKIAVTYDSPWWRESGLVGQFTSLKGPICFSWEISDNTQDLYALVLFVSGNIAMEWHTLSKAARRAAIISHMAELAGTENAEKAKAVVEYEEVEWSKEYYIGGGPTSSLGPGLLRKYGEEMRLPFGGVHFAGTELAYEWKGYLEGAVTSGMRAAGEVTRALC